MAQSGESTWVIYGICLTDDPKIRYVGYTTLGASQRLRSHFKDMNRRDYPLYRWMQKHGKSRIQARVLEYCPTDDYTYLDYAEIYWINSLRELGSDLFNIEYGGRGGRRQEFTESTRNKLSEASKRGWEAHPNRFKGQPKSEAWKAAASTRALGPLNPNYGKKWSDEDRARHKLLRQLAKIHKDTHSVDNTSSDCTHCAKGKF